jgi:uncharacterized protein involved in exopolysaccharide biosynthesis
LNSYAKVLQLVADTQFTEIPDTLPPHERPSPHGELSNVGRALLRSWWIIALCGVIAVAAGIGVGSRLKSNYQATAYVLLNTTQFQQAVAGGSSPVDSLTAEGTAAAMLTPLRQARAAQAAGLTPSADYGVNVTTASNSNVLDVVGTAASQRAAAALADAAADQLIAAVKQANNNALRGARAAVRSQLASAKRGQRLPLASQLNTFSTLEALADQNVEIIQRALIPGVPSGPGKARIAGIALVLGLILGAALALLRRERPRVGRV